MIKRISILISTVMVVAVVYGQSADQWLKQGNDYYEKQQFSKAVESYQKAAEAGSLEGQFNLGYALYNGEGIDKDYATAAMWFKRAARKGFAKAQYNLAYCYMYGRGVPIDYDKALKNLTDAANNGNQNAQLTLAECYEKGVLVMQDKKMSQLWKDKAAGKHTAAIPMQDCIDWVNPPPGLGEYSSDQARAGRIARNLNSFTYGCLNSKSFYDHQLMCVRNVLDGTKWKQDDVKHLYFDLCWPRSCGNASHGCRWKDEFGDTVRDNDLLRLREYFIRVLRMVRRKSPDGWLWGHIFPSRTPSDNFFDLIVGGEMYDSKVYKQVSYYDVLDPELVRIAYGTRCVEMTTALIPQFLRSLECFAPARKKYWDPNDPKHDRAIRHFIAYTSLFGLIQCFDIWDRRQRLLPQGKGQVDIWHQTLKVLGGSPARKYLGPVKPGVYAGSFTGNGKMLLIILNDTDKEQIVVCPAGGKTAVGQDIFSRKSYAAQNGRVECRLAPRDSVFILWK